MKFFDLASKQTFLPYVIENVTGFLTDYFDNVREQAQLIVLFVCQQFIQENHTLSQAQDRTLNVLKANALIGWGQGMSGQVKDAADMEAELSKHLFVDPQAFLKSVIAIMIDETHGRDNLLGVIKEFNRKAPFMMLNDYRVAVGTNSLRRIEILKELIFK